VLTDPRARIVALFCLGTLTLCLDRVASLAFVAVLTSALLLAHPRAAAWRLRLLGVFALFAWSTAISQGLFYADWPRTPAFSIGPVVFAREGLVHGLAQSLRFMAVFAGGVLLAVSTTPERIGTGLLALRLPYGLVLMATAAFRFVPLVTEEWFVVRAARRRRGRPAWRRSPVAWLRLEVSLLRPLAARAIRRARTLAESLETRGFHPTAPRAVREPLRLRLGEAFLLGVIVLLTVATVSARLLWAAYAAELWYAPALRPLYGFVRAWL
jgi:energy-coupling factor transport system permease protein